jgi:hypothetical protein
MFTIRAKDFDDAYFKVNSYLFHNDAYEYIKSGSTAHSFHNTIIMKSADCTLRLTDINYTRNKWIQLNKLYLDPQELGAMVGRLLHYRNRSGGKRYVPDIAMAFKRRKNMSGSCLLNIAIGYNPISGWHAEVYSRASELTARWYCDLIYIHVLLREIGAIVGFTPSDVTVFWRMACCYQSITSIALFLYLNGEEDWMKSHNPEDFPRGSWKFYTIKRFQRAFEGDDYLNYGVQKRAGIAYKMLKGLIPAREPIEMENLQLLAFSPQSEEDVIAELNDGNSEDYIILPDNLMLGLDILALANEGKEKGDFQYGGYR